MSLQKPDERMLKLAEKWLNGTITSEEKIEFDQWYNSFDDSLYETESFEGEDHLQNRLKRKIFNQANIELTNRLSKPRIYFWLGIAASLILVASVSVYFLYSRSTRSTEFTQIKNYKLLPGTNKATLTLGDGRKVVLDDALSGNIAKQGSVTVNKAGDGKVTYDKLGDGAEANKLIVYNTLTTPKGGQYRLTLADGTQVWLNAASSIKFPTVFTGQLRQVEVSGEAYFEVAHNASRPFRVSSANQQVEVLGTHFDINEYADEPVAKTTLLEGRVKIIKDNQSAILNPGEQAQVQIEKGASSIIVTAPAHLDETVAWKNGFFEFNHADVASIMRQVARWYDVDVVYAGKMPDKTFSGNISREVSAQQLLEILSYSGLHFRIEGRKIIITP